MEFVVNEDSLFDILRRMQVPCRSGLNGTFTDQTRLQVIDAELTDSPFSNVFHGVNCDIYTKNQKTDFSDGDVLLVSTHVDTVESIQTLFAIQDDERRLLAGTFDNTITNAACVYLMKYHDLPDNVVFAFTADEETGRCRGAARAYRYLKEHGADPEHMSVLSLDVTYEGFDNQCGFTLENLTDVSDVSAFVEFANNMELPYVFAAPTKTFIPDNLPRAYLSPHNSWFDEGSFYGRYVRDGLREAVSLCMPVHTRPRHNDMHTDYGVLAQTDAFLTYTKVLDAFAADYLKERSYLLEQASAQVSIVPVQVSRNLLQEFIEEDQEER